MENVMLVEYLGYNLVFDYQFDTLGCSCTFIDVDVIVFRRDKF
jgi:hypothetical protein